MNGSLLHSRLRFTATAALAASAGVLLVYYGQLDTGLYYDDYHFLRPVHPLELRRVWYGSWDPTGIESPFYRPVTAWLFALRFWLFGLNTSALHALSAAGHVLCAVLVAWFLRREQAAPAVCLAAAWLYAIHPLFPFAQVSWLTNQMHLAESIVVLSTLLAWQAIRDRPVQRHFVLLPLAALAFLIKEDAIVLLPVIAALALLRAWLEDPAGRRRSLVLVPVTGAALATLIAFRHVRLGRLGGYGVPAMDQALAQFWRGLDATLLLWPTRTPWQAVAATIAIAVLAAAIVRARSAGLVVRATWCAALATLAFTLPALFYDIPYSVLSWQGIASGAVITVTLLAAGLAAGRGHFRPLLVMATGLIITIGFNVPFALVSKREQYHLIALGGVILLAGAFGALLSASSRRAAVLTICLAGSLVLGVGAREHAAAFRPCAETVLRIDEDVLGWWVLPPELRQWLTVKKERCEAGLAAGSPLELPVISWGLHERVHENGETYWWTSDRVTLLVRRDTESLSLAFRSPDASASAPTRVRVLGGPTPVEVALTSGDWHYVTVRLAPGLLTRLRSAHRLDITVDPWFVPAVRDPQQTDLRRFGVHMTVIEN